MPLHQVARCARTLAKPRASLQSGGGSVESGQCFPAQLWRPILELSAHQFTEEADFAPRNDLDSTALAELFAWDEAEFLRRTEGSAIRRIGHECWLRNIAVALGNATDSDIAIMALRERVEHPSEMVREHVQWALGQHHPAAE